MSDPGGPIARATRTQRAASAPGSSAWVGASAGSGKTKVLTDRALRLMLAGARPGRILCLTFTKAAAAEMANRIVEKLAAWATAPEYEVRAALEALDGARPDDATLLLARSLFAAVVDTPGGLKVQTVHAFCQGALERFPVEAGAPPGFEALDERAAADLLSDARDRMLRRIMAGDADDALVAALDRMTLRGGAERLDEVMSALLAERARIAALGGPEGAVEAAVAALGFTDETAAATAPQAALILPETVEAELRRIAAALAGGKKTNQTRAAAIGNWLALPSAERAPEAATLFSAFFTKAGEGDPLAETRIADKAVRDANPWFDEAYFALLDFLAERRDVLRCAECALDTTAAIRLAATIGERYAALKATRAALDFDDLILKTRDLLLSDGGAGWALYKLDQGIDHILVDEAQDTNPEQWQVIHALGDEFFRSWDEDDRTLFAVGDPKQSIFSFQRADPVEFENSRRRFQRAAVEAAQPFEDASLEVSFRSVQSVLDVVDQVFAGPPATDGLSPDGLPPRHSAAREGQPGLVELWPLTPAEKPDRADPWTPVLAYPESGESAETRLAEAVAAKIAGLIADPAERVGHTPDRPGGRPIRAGDVMVVVQSRREFGDALARALKRKGVATAGVDRMRLSRQLVVRDLMALAQAAILPEDDLTLACLLKSPLGGLSEEELFRLAHGRKRQPLWRRLKQAAAAGGAAAAAWDLLDEAMRRADFSPPFDFYHWALGPRFGRAKLVAAMGEAALDPIDEFMSLALRYGAERPASLTGFLAWIDRESVEIKRESDGASGGVRLLTAHAAKGLQAPIVFLPDTTRSPPADSLKLYWTDAERGRAPILGPSRGDRAPAVVDALAAERARRQGQERHRLLYVAMTRAEDRLYVAGWESGKPNDDSWHALVSDGFERLEGVEARPCDFSDQPIRVFGETGPRLVPSTPEQTPEGVVDLPSWWTLPLATPPPAIAMGRAPSRAVTDGDAVDDVAALSPLARRRGRAAEARRFGRGLLIHRLLERLPATPEPERLRVGRAFIARAAADLAPDEAAGLLDATLSLIVDPEFAAVFGLDALAEAPIAGEIAGRRHAGVIDRLSVGADRVLIVDFKTNRPPPAAVEATPAAYLEQMALYRALARQAFPGRAIDLALLWTAIPRLDRLDDGLLDAFAPGEQPAH